MLLPLLQDTPNTVNYLALGYVVLIGLPVLYILSWFYRLRNMEKDLELIQTLQKDEQARAAAPVANRPLPNHEGTKTRIP
jgi:hypothetical protein